MSETIKVIHDTIFVQGENPLEVINKVDQFYERGWNHLVTIGSLILAVGAIVVPFAMDWLKKRQYRLDKKVLENYLKAELAKMELAIKKDSDELTAYKENIAIELAEDRSESYFVTGLLYINTQDYDSALIQFFYALKQCIIVGDLHRVRVILNQINKLRGTQSVEKIKSFQKIHNISIAELVHKIEKLDSSGTITELTRLKEVYGDVIY